MRRFAEKDIVLLISLAGACLMPFMLSAVNVAMPAIGREFSVNAITLSWTATSYLLTSAIFLLPMGRLADIYGKKRVYWWGIGSFTLTSILCGLSPSISMLIACRAFQGIAAAMIFGTGTAILTAVFPPGERGRVLGLNVAFVYLGLAMGPFLGGFLTQHWGWRSIFWVSCPMAAVLTVLIPLLMKGEWISARDEPFDLSGSVLYGAAMVSVFYGFSMLPSERGVAFLAGGLAGLGAFGWLESKRRSPVLNIGLFRNNRVFVFSSLAALINYSATYAVGFLLSLYLQYIKGLSPQMAGFVMISQPLMQAVFSPFAGRLSDRVESRKIASAGMLLTAAGLVMLIFVRQATPLTYVIGALLMLGVGFGLFSSPNTNAIMGAVEKEFYGVASGLLGTMRLTGQMFSMGITTLVFALVIGRERALQEDHGLFVKSVGLIFVILAILCGIGVFFSWARGRNRRAPEPQLQTR